MSDSSRPHGLQPTRLLCPWDFPGKRTGVGCHCLLQNNKILTANKPREEIIWGELNFHWIQKKEEREGKGNKEQMGPIGNSEIDRKFKPDYEDNRASLVAQMVKNMPAVQETWVQSLGPEDPLEKGMATHYSILAQRISWTEEPGGLQSMGSQRVRHDWVTNTFTFHIDDYIKYKWFAPTPVRRQRLWDWI